MKKLIEKLSDKQTNTLLQVLTSLMIILSIVCLCILFTSCETWKGNDYIDFEKQMIQSSQMKVENSQYFILNNGKVELKK